MRQRRARWLWAVLQAGGGDDISPADMEEHLAPRGLEMFPTPSRLQQFAENGPLRGAELVAERDEGEAYVHEARTASGLRLEHRTVFDEEGKILGSPVKVLGGGSNTAIIAAAVRAAHLRNDRVRIHEDPFAEPLAGEMAESIVAAVAADPASIPSRWLVAIRSRFAEDAVKDAFQRHGVDQCVLLGAGLDSFAYRNDLPDLQVFEVDLPTSQDWKRGRLRECEIAIPPNVRLVPCDFEHDDFRSALELAGFRMDRPAVVLWLGVVYYLTSEAIDETLRGLSALPPHTSVIFDFLVPREEWGRAGEAMERVVIGLDRTVAINGEPWLSHHDKAGLEVLLRSHGFESVETYDWMEMARLYVDAADLPTMLPCFGLARATRTR